MPPPFTSIAEPTIVLQPKRDTTVETSVVTRGRFVSIAAIRARIVCIAQSRELDIDLASRLVAVAMVRDVSISAASRRLALGALSPRVVVIPPDETCCE